MSICAQPNYNLGVNGKNALFNRLMTIESAIKLIQVLHTNVFIVSHSCRPSNLEKFYLISYMWYYVIAIVVALIVALLVSWCSGW